MNEISNGVLAWWAFLSIAALTNITIWFIARKKVLSNPETSSFRKWQLYLSAGFVFGCAFRSFIPRADVQRICFVDHWISVVAIGRSVATLAELCFMAQASLYLYELAKDSNSGLAKKISYIIVPLIAIAETFSWYAVLTTNYIGNAVEQSIWCTCGALLLMGYITIWFKADNILRKYFYFYFTVMCGFIYFMCTVDIPMYIYRYTLDELSGKKYFSLIEGFIDAATRWVVTFSWEEWNTEMAWMGFYFSVIVWVSIFIIFAPKFKGQNSLQSQY